MYYYPFFKFWYLIDGWMTDGLLYSTCRRICDIYDLFAPRINALTYLLTYLCDGAPHERSWSVTYAPPHTHHVCYYST